MCICADTQMAKRDFDFVPIICNDSTRVERMTVEMNKNGWKQLQLDAKNSCEEKRRCNTILFLWLY